MSHKHLFHIHNKQHLLCTSGNFRAIRSCQCKDDETRCSVDSIKCFAHAAGFAAARRCLGFLVLLLF